MRVSNILRSFLPLQKKTASSVCHIEDAFTVLKKKPSNFDSDNKSKGKVEILYSKGDRGSPCLTPFEVLKGSVKKPLISI